MNHAHVPYRLLGVCTYELVVALRLRQCDVDVAERHLIALVHVLLGAKDHGTRRVRNIPVETWIVREETGENRHVQLQRTRCAGN